MVRVNLGPKQFGDQFTEELGVGFWTFMFTNSIVMPKDSRGIKG